MRGTLRLASTLLLVHASGAAAQGAASVAGTYRIAICKVAPCSPSPEDSVRRVVWGTLVLGDTSINRATMPATAARFVETRRIAGELNACWILSRVDRHARTYAGIGGVAVTTWSTQGNSVTVPLYAGPDAGTRMVAMLVDGRLLGSAGSNGMTAPGGTWGPDTIVAVRTGPPDYSGCLAQLGLPALPPLSIRGPALLRDVPTAPDLNTRYAIVLRPGITLDTIPRLLTRLESPARRMWDPGTNLVFLARPIDVSPLVFADSVASKVRQLRNAGVLAAMITVIGAEDGATIAARALTKITNAIGYVFIGGCTDSVRVATGGVMRGDVLSLVGEQNAASSSCTSTFASSRQLGAHAEIRLPLRLARGGASTMSLYDGGAAEGWEDFVSDWILRRKIGPPW